jgi:Uma2 family endonuclease
MVMPLAVPRYTIDDLNRFPRDGNRYELLDGMLLVTPAPLPVHQIVLARLQYEIHRYLEPRSLARVVGQGAVEIAPRTHLEPDLLVFPSSYPVRSRWRDLRGWWLACEVFSEGSVIYDRDFKRDAYLALGVREVWLVNWRDAVVQVSRGAVKDARHRGELVWHPEGMGEPLTIDLTRIFRGLNDEG